MKWITREKVKVDRVACPWLIKKFIDPVLSCINAVQRGSAAAFGNGRYWRRVEFDIFDAGSAAGSLRGSE